MKAAVPLNIIGMAVLFFLCGCATTFETPVRSFKSGVEPQTLRVGVLPPMIDPSLEEENFTPEKPFYKQLLDGRGTVVTSISPSKDIGLEVVSTLTRAGIYKRIFTVENNDHAQKLGADSLLTVIVYDYRVVQLGSNKQYPLMFLLSPLMSQYWIRWRTLEARLDWEVKLTSMADGSTIYTKRLAKSYTSTVRSASGHYFTDKMLMFLQERAVPDFIGELFELELEVPSCIEPEIISTPWIEPAIEIPFTVDPEIDDPVLMAPKEGSPVIVDPNLTTP